MHRPDSRPVPTRGSGRDRASRVLAAGLSLCLHGAVLTAFFWLRDVTPPEPYMVVTVDLIEAADIAGISGGQTDQRSPPPGVNEDAISDHAPSDEIAVAPPPPEESVTTTPVADAPAVEIRDIPPPEETMAKMPVADAPSVEFHHAPPPEEPKSKMPAAAGTQSEVGVAQVEWTPKAELTGIRIPERQTDSTDRVNLPRATEDFVKRSSAFSKLTADPPLPRRKPKPPKLRTDKASKRTRLLDEIDRWKDASPRPMEKPASPNHGATGDDRAVEKSSPSSKPDTGTEQAPAASQAVASRPIDGSVGGQPHSPPRIGGAGPSNPPPRYPYLARRQGQQGRVILRVLVSAAGKAKAIAIRRSSGYRLLDGAAVKAVRKWRFVPARMAGIQVSGSVDVPVLFTLTD